VAQNKICVHWVWHLETYEVVGIVEYIIEWDTWDRY
jgi:hypothetical protein